MILTKLNKSDYLILLVYFVLFALVDAYDHTFHFDRVTYTFINPDGSSYTQENTSPPLLGYFIGVPISVMSTLFIVGIFFIWLIPKFLIETKKYFVFAALGILVLVIFGIFRITILHWVDNVPWQVYPPAFDLMIKSLNISVSTAGLPLGILLTKKYFESQMQISQIQKKQKESELKLLQAQLSPHFLFNNLNTLDALIDTKPKQAKKYIAHLSELYRYLISTKDKEVVLLKEELSMIENYFYLIETRFGDVYSFSIIGNHMIDAQYLPVGALQILIENVVKHNRTSIDKPIKTTILVENQRIVVTNNKAETSKEIASFGTGLENLQERYALLFDKKIKITNSDFEFQVSIPLIEVI